MILNESKFNSSWSTKKLSDLGTYSRGKSKHRPRNDSILFNGGGYPLIQTGDVTISNLYILNHSQEYNNIGLQQSKLWDPGTLCITIAANIAESAILSYPACFPDSIVGFRANKSETSEVFIYYLFEYLKCRIKNIASGSIQDNINLNFLSKINFKVPNIEYQEKIVKTLALIDNKINKNNEINDNLASMAMDIYMHTFVSKEPNAQIADILVENAKSKVKVGEAKALNAGDIPFFTSGEAILKWTEPMLNQRVCYLNTGGNPGVKFYVGKAAYSTDTWAVHAKNELTDYLYLFLQSIIEEIGIKYFKGTGLKHLQKDGLKSKRLYLPTEVELLDFNSKIKPMFDTISENYREIQRLTTLRDWLLPMLMNGQATVD